MSPAEKLPPVPTGSLKKVLLSTKISDSNLSLGLSKDKFKSPKKNNVQVNSIGNRWARKSNGVSPSNLSTPDNSTSGEPPIKVKQPIRKKKTSGNPVKMEFVIPSLVAIETPK
ncbi:hypothetical protein LXL04_019826 [Taraxacum kok-saghyz]